MSMFNGKRIKAIEEHLTRIQNTIGERSSNGILSRLYSSMWGDETKELTIRDEIREVRKDISLICDYLKIEKKTTQERTYYAKNS